MNKLFLGIILIAIVVGGVMLWMNGNQNNQQAPLTASPTEAVPTQASVTPEATVSPSGQKEAMINVTATGFDSQTVTIAQGTKVTWTNKSGTDISINSDPHPTHTDYAPLNLGRVSNGQSISLVFGKAGKYGYHNHFSPDQTGTIVVQ